MGRGRHAIVLGQAGFRAFGVDVKLDAVREALGRAAAYGLTVRGWCADLTQYPLPREAFEVVVVTRYLQRDLFASIREAVTPDGVVVYETFTVNQRALGAGPTSPDHLLQPGELRERFSVFEVVFLRRGVGARSPRAPRGTPAKVRLKARQPDLGRAFRCSYVSRGRETLPGPAAPCAWSA